MKHIESLMVILFAAISLGGCAAGPGMKQATPDALQPSLAQQGNAAAQCNLGRMYESGQGGYSCTVTGRRLSLETLSISSL